MNLLEAGPLLLAAIFMIAMLYSSVGHGGASGYLALLAIAGAAPVEMRSSALLLNICVSGIAFIRFRSAGHFNWNIFWPFAIGSVPFAFIGAGIPADPSIYRKLLAICLLFAAFRIFLPLGTGDRNSTGPALVPSFFIGAAIGIISGMVGIGGGIILSPILLLFRWSTAHQAAVISALFIFVNSCAGLVGLPGDSSPSSIAIFWSAAALLGGLAGSYLGSKRASDLRLRQILGSILTFASIKLLIA